MSMVDEVAREFGVDASSRQRPHVMNHTELAFSCRLWTLLWNRRKRRSCSTNEKPTSQFLAAARIVREVGLPDSNRAPLLKLALGVLQLLRG